MLTQKTAALTGVLKTASTRAAPNRWGKAKVDRVMRKLFKTETLPLSRGDRYEACVYSVSVSSKVGSYRALQKVGNPVFESSCCRVWISPSSRLKASDEHGSMLGLVSVFENACSLIYSFSHHDARDARARLLRSRDTGPLAAPGGAGRAGR